MSVDKIVGDFLIEAIEFGILLEQKSKTSNPLTLREKSEKIFSIKSRMIKTILSEIDLQINLCLDNANEKLLSLKRKLDD